MVKIEFTPLSLDRKIFPFKKGFKKNTVTNNQQTSQKEGKGGGAREGRGGRPGWGREGKGRKGKGRAG